MLKINDTQGNWKLLFSRFYSNAFKILIKAVNFIFISLK